MCFKLNNKFIGKIKIDSKFRTIARSFCLLACAERENYEMRSKQSSNNNVISAAIFMAAERAKCVEKKIKRVTFLSININININFNTITSNICLCGLCGHIFFLNCSHQLLVAFVCSFECRQKKQTIFLNNNNKLSTKYFILRLLFLSPFAVRSRAEAK